MAEASTVRTDSRSTIQNNNDYWLLVNNVVVYWLLANNDYHEIMFTD